MNPINKLFETTQPILSIYFTAGFPKLESTSEILDALENAGTDLIEIGMPFSDPIADGATIQMSSKIALKNGISLEKLFSQLESRQHKAVLILMGYLNPVLQYGMENFLKDCKRCGVSGVILPDLPIEEYEKMYAHWFDQYGIHPVFLVTPATNQERLDKIIALSRGFIYFVSTNTTTGTRKAAFDDPMLQKKLAYIHSKKPVMIGFGISDHDSFKQASALANGAIIGSAYIKALAKENPDLSEITVQFIKSIKKYNYDHTI